MKLTLKDFDFVINQQPKINIYRYMLEDINNYILNNVEWEEFAYTPCIRFEDYNSNNQTLIITIYVHNNDNGHIKTINIEYYYNNNKLIGWDFQTKKE